MFTIPKLTIPRVIALSLYDRTNERATNRRHSRTTEPTTDCKTVQPRYIYQPAARPKDQTSIDNTTECLSSQPTSHRATNRPYGRTTEPGIDCSTERLSHQPTGRHNGPATNRRYGRTSEPTTDCVTVQPSNKPTAPPNDRVNLDNKAKLLSRQLTDLTTEPTSHQPTEQPNDPRIDCPTERPSQ